MNDLPPPPVIGLPAPVDRPQRLGPFPSARSALKFVAIAAGGALVASAVGPLAWVPFLGGGFLLTAGRDEGRTLEQQLGDFVRFQVRQHAGGSRPRRLPRLPRGVRVATIDAAHTVGILSTGGVPVSFLPPADARTLFESFRELLRSVEGGLFVRVATQPLSSTPFRLPFPVASAADESQARSGYAEMVRLLCRHRRRRTVHVVLWTSGTGAAERAALEGRMDALTASLRGLGLDPQPLQGEELARALAGMGWRVAAAP
ncbi:MAG TPA: hypothetical protein VFG07_10665 [Thermoplasmata archaeon]|nr:hypothetical protein [Thermoplasmata archaeon]